MPRCLFSGCLDTPAGLRWPHESESSRSNPPATKAPLGSTARPVGTRNTFTRTTTIAGVCTPCVIATVSSRVPCLTSRVKSSPLRSCLAIGPTGSPRRTASPSFGDVIDDCAPLAYLSTCQAVRPGQAHPPDRGRGGSDAAGGLVGMYGSEADALGSTEEVAAATCPEKRHASHLGGL